MGRTPENLCRAPIYANRGDRKIQRNMELNHKKYWLTLFSWYCSLLDVDSEDAVRSNSCALLVLVSTAFASEGEIP